MDKLSGPELTAALARLFPGRVEEVEDRFDTVVRTDSETIIPLLTALKQKFGMNYLADMVAVDYKTRFEVTYRVHSVPDNRQIVVKVDVDHDHPSLPTATGVWLAADWQEREIFDLMGVNFTGRSISRILLPEDFQGHPLRKDYKGGRQV